MTTAAKIPPAPTWDLESVFPGGSQSEEFKAFRDKVKKSLDDAGRMLAGLPRTLDSTGADAWEEFILQLQSLAEDIELIVSFAQCLTSQDVGDDTAHSIEGEGDLYMSEWEKLKTGLEALSLQQSDANWQRLVSSDRLKGIRFFLDEIRDNARRKMPAELESLALDLSVSGYHAWNRLYDKMAGILRVSLVEDGETNTVSLGQLATKMSHADRSVRAQAFAKLTEAWQSRADLAAMTLNAQAGFRLALYRRRGWESPLYEPLTMARLTQESLDAMWSVVARATERLAPYIDAKKRLLGIDKFLWYDEMAPCGKTGRLYSYDEAAKFVIDNVADFSTQLAEFCRMAIDKRWIEAENRPGKAGGGYCTTLGSLRQSRIFMTYANTYEHLLTLAHELGHAYHQYVLSETPFFATWYPMTLAETASTFTELLVIDAALQACDDLQEKLMLLDQKLQQAYTMFCNLHCRYVFDNAFYAERARGIVSKDRLCQIMVDAQRQSFGSLLDESGYHPLFWASKLHFFATDVPYYNFPYTFGYLFAGGVYDRARTEGRAFADKYRALLADTGNMKTEDVAAKHLGVDLTRESFWEDAVNRSIADVESFVRLAGKA